MSKHVKRWRVIDWPEKPVRLRSISATCPRCGWDGELEMAETPAIVIATIGLGVVFDPPGYKPPENALPEAIQCRGCRRIFASAVESNDVR